MVGYEELESGFHATQTQEDHVGLQWRVRHGLSATGACCSSQSDVLIKVGGSP